MTSVPLKERHRDIEDKSRDDRDMQKGRQHDDRAEREVTTSQGLATVGEIGKGREKTSPEGVQPW